MKPVAIIQHHASDGPAFFGTWLRDQGIPSVLLAMHAGDRLPSDLQGYSGLCLLGGPMSANDDLPYYPPLFALLRQALAEAVPVLGHCLGGQLLSRALGGRVQAAEHSEIGWSLLQPVHALASDWFGTQPLQLFQWHGESFSIPPGATQLLRGAHCANQAYVLNGLHLGMQFHCEVDEAKVRHWLELGADEIRQSASPGVQSAAAILQDLQQQLVHSQAIASHIYQRWATGLRP